MSDDQTTQACTEIHKWIEQELGRKEPDTHIARASATNNCVRKNWLKHKGYSSEALQSRMVLVFGFGDLVEHWAKALIKQACVGPDRLYSEIDFGTPTGEKFVVQHREFDVYKQERVTISLPGVEMDGHGDGWGKRNSDGEWEYLEIKSASSYSYDKFVEAKDGEDLKYINQLHSMMLSDKAKALGVRSSRLFYFNKNTSHIFDRLYQYDQNVARNLHRQMMVALGPNEPAIPSNDQHIGFQPVTYRGKPTGKLKLGYKCGYCEFKSKCYPDTNVSFENGKPVWIQRSKKDESA